MERHVANAAKVATWLSIHPKVLWVSYAGLPGNKYHGLAQRYLPKGAGSVFTFGVKGGYQAGVRAVERCRLLSHLANIGDTRSLILHPASTTHRQLSEEQRSEEHTSEPQSLMRNSYAVFCLKKKKRKTN